MAFIGIHMRETSEKPAQEPSMEKIRALFEQSAMTYDELGKAMGYPAETARKSAYQFISKTADPRVSVLRRFAKAMRVDVKDLL